jgi:hypothetical protein
MTSEESPMEIHQNEECNICDKVKEVVIFDWDMSESQICQDCLIKIYRESRGWGVE